MHHESTNRTLLMYLNDHNRTDLNNTWTGPDNIC